MSDTFRVTHLGQAAFILAGQKLRFLGTELNPDTDRVEFVFDDPQHEGEDLAMEYDNGEKVSATDFFDKLFRARRLMHEKLGNRKVAPQDVIRNGSLTPQPSLTQRAVLLRKRGQDF